MHKYHRHYAVRQRYGDARLDSVGTEKSLHKQKTFLENKKKDKIKCNLIYYI